MGLKIGFAVLAAKRGRYVRLNTRDGHPHSLARVVRRGRTRFCLIYPDGKTGFLFVNRNQQFDLWFVKFEPQGFVPTREQSMARDGTLPCERIMFNDGYTVSEKPPEYLPPPAVHLTDEERFRNPRGLWEKVVASCLRRGEVLG